MSSLLMDALDLVDTEVALLNVTVEGFCVHGMIPSDYVEIHVAEI